MAIIIGSDTSGTDPDFYASGNTYAVPVAASSSARLATISCQFKVANATLTNCKVGIYTNGGGNVPTTRLAFATVSSGYTGTGVFSGDVSAAALDLVSGTTYWLAVSATGEQVNIQGTTSSIAKEILAFDMGADATGETLGSMSVTLAIWGESASFTGFTNITVPTVTGSLNVGSTLTANSGSWTPTPGSYVYSWHRADDTSATNDADIGATGATYTLAAADSGKYIRAGVYPQQ